MEHSTQDDDLADIWEAASEPAEIVVATPVALAERPKSKQEELQELEDDIFETSLRIMSDATHFSEIDPSKEEPPAEWVEKLGSVEAWRRFRVARAAWLGAKDAPVGIAMTQRLVNGLAKARAIRLGGNKTINIEMAVFPAPGQNDREVYGEVIEVVSGGD